MTPRRRLVANAVVLTILAGQALAIVADRELWPFSHYPMYADLSGPEVTRLWLFGVTATGEEVPFSKLSWIHPLRLMELEDALDRMDGPRWREALEDVLARYDVRRRAGQNAGPPFVALRLYRMTFRTDPDLPYRDHPLSRDLLAEVHAEPR